MEEDRDVRLEVRAECMLTCSHDVLEKVLLDLDCETINRLILRPPAFLLSIL